MLLQKFGLENGGGHINRAEFIILCMVRTGTYPKLVAFIFQRFEQLNTDKGGTLSIAEITERKCTPKDGNIVTLFKDATANVLALHHTTIAENVYAIADKVTARTKTAHQPYHVAIIQCFRVFYTSTAACSVSILVNPRPC
jgi:hypothetical protein